MGVKGWNGPKDGSFSAGRIRQGRLPALESGIDIFFLLSFRCQITNLFQMPFADDVRKYTFASLDHLVNKKGEVLTEHSYLPTEDQLEAMDHFVDAMDLMDAGEKDEEGYVDLCPRFTRKMIQHTTGTVRPGLTR